MPKDLVTDFRHSSIFHTANIGIYCVSWQKKCLKNIKSLKIEGFSCIFDRLIEKIIIFAPQFTNN